MNKTNRHTFKLRDNQFRGKLWTTGVNSCDHFDWDRDPVNIDNDPVDSTNIFYTNLSWQQVTQHVQYKHKFAWGTESPEIYPGNYHWIGNNHHHFKNVFTHQKHLLELDDKFKFAPGCSCWIRREDFNMHEKTKLLSCIVSKKKQTTGHKFRLSLIDTVLDNNDRIDLYGKDFRSRRLGYKLDGLKDYAFSIAMENTQRDYYFSEKLIDCLVTGTVPVYYGCPGIGDKFDIDGFLIFNTQQELQDIVNSIDMDMYHRMLPAVKRNYELAKQYDLGENYIYNNYNHLFHL